MTAKKVVSFFQQKKMTQSVAAQGDTSPSDATVQALYHCHPAFVIDYKESQPGEGGEARRYFIGMLLNDGRSL